jgi:hypothetical protein
MTHVKGGIPMGLGVGSQRQFALGSRVLDASGAGASRSTQTESTPRQAASQSRMSAKTSMMKLPNGSARIGAATARFQRKTCQIRSIVAERSVTGFYEIDAGSGEGQAAPEWRGFFERVTSNL